MMGGMFGLPIAWPCLLSRKSAHYRPEGSTARRCARVGGLLKTKGAPSLPTPFDGLQMAARAKKRATRAHTHTGIHLD